MRRNAALFVAISLLSGFGGTAMTLVAGIWILDLTGSVSLAGLGGLAVYAPTLAAPWLGVVVDRLPRRPLLVAVNLALAVVLLSLSAVRSADQVWLIFLVLLARGVSYVLLGAGESALLPAALSPAALGDVNGWRSSAQEGMKLVAPLAGAALYTWRGGSAVAAVSATMPLVVAALYLLIRLPSRTRGEAHAPQRTGEAHAPQRTGEAHGAGGDAGSPSEDPPGRGVRAGLRILWTRREIRVPVLVAAVAIGMSGFTNASLYARITQDLGLPSTFLGVLASAQGAGSIVAGLLVGRLVARHGATAVAAAGAVLFAAGCVVWCLPWWPAMAVASAVVGVGLPWTLIAAVIAVQSHTPDALLGRASASADTAMFGPIAVANPLGAAVVHLGSRVPLLVAAGATVAAAVLAVRRTRPVSAARPAGRTAAR